MTETLTHFLNMAASSLSASPLTWVVVTAVFLLAGFVKGVVGMGLPTVAMGLLAVTMPPAQAAAVLIVPSFVTNIWQLLAGPAFKRLFTRLWSMMAGVLMGTIAGSGWLTSNHAGLAMSGLGVVLAAYAILGLLRVRFHVNARHEAMLSPLVGLVTGLVTGATGVFVIPAVPYLQSLELEKEDLIQALGLSFTVSTIALAAGLWLRTGADTSSGVLAGISLLALVPAMIGMMIGQSLRMRMGVDTFRRVFFAGLLVLGLYLAAESLF